MKLKRSLAAVIFELPAVLLITGAAFIWAKDAAMAVRGYEAYGGEYLILLLPVIYYTLRQTVLEWIADIRKLRKECDRG